MVSAPVDPLTDDTAVATRFRHEDVAASLELTAGLTRCVTARLRTLYRHIGFGEDPDPLDVDLVTVYDPMRVPAFADGIHAAATELDVTWDTRRARHVDQSPVVPSRGWRLYGYARLQAGLTGEPSRFVRWGGELERDLDLHGGDRVLVLRARLEGTAGALRQVPFIDLPTLGGQPLLRGYPGGRFRDRHAGLVSIDYLYPVSQYVRGFLAIDAGRVWRSLDEVGVDGVRVGFGGGFVVFTFHSFLAQIAVFTSIDGGIESVVGFTSDSKRRIGR